jgi:hypothetical protein
MERAHRSSRENTLSSALIAFCQQAVEDWVAFRREAGWFSFLATASQATAVCGHLIAGPLGGLQCKTVPMGRIDRGPFHFDDTATNDALLIGKPKFAAIWLCHR